MKKGKVTATTPVILSDESKDMVKYLSDRFLTNKSTTVDVLKMWSLMECIKEDLKSRKL